MHSPLILNCGVLEERLFMKLDIFPLFLTTLKDDIEIFISGSVDSCR